VELVFFFYHQPALTVTQVEVESSILFRKHNLLAAVCSTWAALQERGLRNLLQSSVELFSLILYLFSQSSQHLNLSILHFLQSYVTHIKHFLRSDIPGEKNLRPVVGTLRISSSAMQTVSNLYMCNINGSVFHLVLYLPPDSLLLVLVIS